MNRRSVLRRMTENAGLTGEVLPGVPLLELSGDDRILIENHQCIVEYTQEEIVIKVSFGCLRIVGKGLVLSCVKKEQLQIHGRVDSVTIRRGGE